MSADAIGVGVIGLGFMGRTHVEAYRAAAAAGRANRLVAVCDQDADRRAGSVATAGNIATGAEAERLFDPETVRGYAEPAELLADPNVALVSICTPTDSHVDLALAALAAGKHVLVEKPVALRASDVERLADAARTASTLCMPAHCIRLWPAWAWLRVRLAQQAFGPVQSAVFRRLGSLPGWSREFYSDAERSGGALMDLHVHDADFVMACFGPPASVASHGSLHHVTTAYRYPRGSEPGALAHVVAEGGWDHSPGWEFRMTFTVVCAEATIDYAFGRDPELQVFRNGEREPVVVAPTSGYDEEVRGLLSAIAAGADAPPVTIADALATARLLEAERQSLASGVPVEL